MLRAGIMGLFFSFFIILPSFANQAYTDVNVAEARKLLKKAIVKTGQFTSRPKLRFSDLLSKDELTLVVYVSKTIHVANGEVFDGQGKLFIWVGDAKCNQDENGQPMFRLHSNSELKNLFLYNSQEGVHVNGSNITISNIVNLNVCEDAVSTRAHMNPNNILVEKSRFYKCEDKALQFNSGLNLIISGNKFYNCKEPIRLMRTNGTVIEGNRCIGCKHLLVKSKHSKNISVQSNTGSYLKSKIKTHK